MITCPQCGAQNLPGLAYCETCGTPLPQQPAAAAGVSAAPQDAGQSSPGPSPTAPPSAPPDVAAAAMPQPVMPADQPPAAPDAGVPSPAAAGANVVAADQDTAAPPTIPPAPAVPAAGASTLTITFPSGQAYTMQGDEANVGRSDAAQNWHPELDVIPYGGGAPDLGVSRHQARLVRQNGDFAVVDVGSTNGTYVNGHAVPYNQPTPLHDGDTLSFGALNTHISIK